jgi:cytochrome oxidase Cu insertion factor (SCO1/SenC/PrrC family)
VFAAPVLAAWFFYLNPEYLPQTRSNRGELLEPPVRFGNDPWLTGVEGAAFDLAALDGRWTLVTVAVAPCGDPCMARLGQQRQIWLALGESRLGVERLLVLNEGDVREAARLTAALPGLRVALAGGPEGGSPADLLGPQNAGRSYIRDPLGRLMMRYAAAAPAQDVLKDMERLLKASKNWIKGAQYGHQ